MTEMTGTSENLNSLEKKKIKELSLLRKRVTIIVFKYLKVVVK